MPMTINGCGHLEKSETTSDIPFLRKKTFTQGMTSFLLNLIELCFLTVGIYTQSMLDSEYDENVNQILGNRFSTNLPTVVVSCFLSFLCSCLVFSLYYTKHHPSEKVSNKKFGVKEIFKEECQVVDGSKPSTMEGTQRWKNLSQVTGVVRLVRRIVKEQSRIPSETESKDVDLTAGWVLMTSTFSN